MYELPKLPYALDALEPVISRDIMDLHYNKHHKAYVTNLNAAVEAYAKAEAANDVAQMISLQQAIKFNGGGHLNHSIFWEILCPVAEASSKPAGELATMIDRDFGSFEAFKEKLTNAAIGVQGSGWAWLCLNRATKRLEIVACPNQDPPAMVALMGIDVWEHAYYLQYKNVRGDYVKAIWQIFNWHAIERRLKI